MIKNKICVVGWHYFEDFYNKLNKISNIDIYIVAHRYNDVLDKLKLNYSVTKNIGLECGCYDWYIKNIWDKKSNVLFMHDDVIIKRKNNIRKLFQLCNGNDYASISGSSKRAASGRCFYLSTKTIRLLLKKFNGIWYDSNQRGYIWGEGGFYDNQYYILGHKSQWKDKVGKNFTITMNYLVKKYNLKYNKIIYDKMEFCCRGENKSVYSKIIKSNVKKLSDNSVFGIKKENILERIAYENGSDKIIAKKGYTKWYDFYFSNIKNENLNIFEMGCDEQSLSVWKKYFINSFIYGGNVDNLLKDNKIINKNNIFIGNNINNNYFENICKEISSGIDIFIDTGKYNGNRISNFEFLFPKMNPGAIYVFEDLKNDNKIVDYLKNKIESLNINNYPNDKNYETIVYEHNQELDTFEKRIASIHFYFNMCFVFKRYCK